MNIISRIIDRIRAYSENTWKREFTYNPDMKIRYMNMLKLLEKQDYESVLDLGCGCQYLKECIDNSIKYTGVDLYNHKDDTIICDFNKKEFPNNVNAELVVMAGILEYIQDIPWFLKKACSVSSKYILLSYNFKEHTVTFADIWRPLLSQKKIFDIMFDNGFRLNKYIPDPLKPNANTTGYVFFERCNRNMT